ncbi:MAG: hypothetical protein CVV27_12815 [Candidatus Melainabacteria bacterium HGW-Melainabacteria-1]|nr:MAG: hypothetical protein CVV27_12815 [Candidatus Melainabacteria bacterium HGW-Melainabacteria-1]
MSTETADDKADEKTYRKALEVLFQTHGRTIQTKQTVFSEGDPGTEIFFIVSGAVSVYLGKGHSKRALWTLWAGEMFGEMALLDQMPRSASIEAALETRLVALDRKTFNQLIGKYPILAQKVIELMGKRMRKMDTQFKLETGYLKDLPQEQTYQPVNPAPKKPGAIR